MSSERGDWSDQSKPVIRILHQLARSGGTIICRCLASMADVVLLSEIHPQGLRMFNPLQQAHQWYGLLTEQDLQKVQGGSLTFQQAISMIVTRCEESGKHLVLRDWSHLDYTGVPFVHPAFEPALANSLVENFELARFSSVRHPLDQWLSLTRKEVFREKLEPEEFIRGATRFADCAEQTGYIRYEDFTQLPDRTLQSLCGALSIPFDEGYKDRWANYTNITGDVLPGRSDRTRIQPLPRQRVDVDRIQTLRNTAGYSELLEKLGYAD